MEDDWKNAWKERNQRGSGEGGIRVGEREVKGLRWKGCTREEGEGECRIRG